MRLAVSALSIVALVSLAACAEVTPRDGDIVVRARVGAPTIGAVPSWPAAIVTDVKFHLDDDDLVHPSALSGTPVAVFCGPADVEPITAIVAEDVGACRLGTVTVRFAPVLPGGSCGDPLDSVAVGEAFSEIVLESSAFAPACGLAEADLDVVL
jgi:hypothetical protein